eukprot:5445156-Amphidinium_carterae.1
MAHGIGTRPYPRVEPDVRLYRTLTQDPPWVFFPSEKKQGYFPYSCVRRFIDSSRYYPIMKLIRITQERYELLPEKNPDHYPWPELEEDHVRFPPTNRDPHDGVVARWRWEEFCYENLQARSHRTYSHLRPRPQCYVCQGEEEEYWDRR